jgi:hypothetical protein
MQQYLQSVLAGTPFERTTTTAAPGSSALAQLLGAGATVAGIGGQSGFGLWGNPNVPAARVGATTPPPIR